MTRTRPDGVPLSSGQPGTEWAERQIEMENEKLHKQAEGSTFFQHAQASALDESGGRFAKQSPTTVVGASANPSYPRLPEGAMGAIPWPEDRNPLGYSVDQMEPVGSEAEQLAAQRILDQRSAARPADGGPAEVPASALSVERAGPPTSSKSLAITGAAVASGAGDGSAANDTVPRSFNRRL